MKIKEFFRPKKIIVIILLILPIIALVSTGALFAGCFGCTDVSNCFFQCSILLNIAIYLLFASPLFYLYLIITLIVYLKSRSKKK